VLIIAFIFLSSSEPIIFDFVDDHPILKKHFATRKATYLESGGEIKSYKF